MPSTILQSDLCSLTHSKRYGHVAIPLSGDMTYRVGQEDKSMAGSSSMYQKCQVDKGFCDIYQQCSSSVIIAVHAMTGSEDALMTDGAWLNCDPE